MRATDLTAPSPSACAPWGRAGPRRRTLLLLGAAVLLLHLALLAWLPLGGSPASHPDVATFATRSIVLPPAPPPAPVFKPKVAAAPVERAQAATKKIVKRRTPATHPPPARAPAATPAPAPVLVPDPDPDAAAATAVQSASAGDATPAAPAGPLDGPPAAVAPGPASVAGAAGAAASAPEAAGEGPAPTRITTPMPLPGPVHLPFAVTAQEGPQPLSGAFGELVWAQDGDRYQARLTTTFLFRTLREWTSSGRVSAAGLVPERYTDTRRRREVTALFDRDRGQIVFNNNKPAVPLLPGAQDRLSVMLHLGALLAGAPGRYPEGSQIAVQTATNSDAGVWVFQVGAEETLHLPAGDLLGRKLVRAPRGADDLKVELWLAPQYGYLPLRLKLTEPDGDFADFQLRQAPPQSAATPGD